MHRAPRPLRVSQLARWISTEQLAIQRSILAAASARDAETILRILEQDRLSPVNVATAAHRLAKVAKKGLRERSVQQLQAPILATATEFGAQATANTIWALAKLGCQEDLLWSSLSHCASQQLREFSGRHLANVSWSLAALARSDAPLLLTLSYEVMLKAEASELTPQSLANVLWSFAFLAMWESKMMLAPLEAVHSYAEAFNPRDLSNTLWALSMYKGSSDFEAVDWRTLLRALARSGSSKAQQLHPNDLTSIAWAFVDATPLQMHWLQRGAMSGMEKMKPSGVPMKYEPLD
ncbi:unnamed protein product [Cladocopium goreaui]|uniref:FAST kinase leucine-rich domain-containing protein n=1 Tax=Cladocopium goreaui TaxID=2562237 RepID=A0A9P1BH11_9DINO|nr:unnamed protein product [Cladocopium goreaui]